jgi:hypothetical protein
MLSEILLTTLMGASVTPKYDATNNTGGVEFEAFQNGLYVSVESIGDFYHALASSSRDVTGPVDLVTELELNPFGSCSRAGIGISGQPWQANTSSIKGFANTEELGPEINAYSNQKIGDAWVECRLLYDANSETITLLPQCGVSLSDGLALYTETSGFMNDGEYTHARTTIGLKLDI